MNLISVKNIEAAGFRRIGNSIWQKDKSFYLRCNGCNRFTDKKSFLSIPQKINFNCVYCNCKNEYSVNSQGNKIKIIYKESK